jgi:hypothetical protein
MRDPSQSRDKPFVESSLIDTVVADRGNHPANSDAWSVGMLLFANSIAIIAALVLGWSAIEVAIFYWIENLVVGFWAILRMLTAANGSDVGRSMTADALAGGKAPFDVTRESERAGERHHPSSANGLAKAFLVLFFCFHFGFFCFVHGFMLQVLLTTPWFSDPSAAPVGASWYNPLKGTDDTWSIAGIGAVLGLFLSHGTSFFRNYLARGEYKSSYLISEMIRPYGRVVLLHLCILAGGFATVLFGAPYVLVVLLMIGKTTIDVWLHLQLHRRSR